MDFERFWVDLAWVGCRGDSKITGYCLGAKPCGDVVLSDARREEWCTATGKQGRNSLSESSREGAEDGTISDAPLTRGRQHLALWKWDAGMVHVEPSDPLGCWGCLCRGDLWGGFPVPWALQGTGITLNWQLIPSCFLPLGKAKYTSVKAFLWSKKELQEMSLDPNDEASLSQPSAFPVRKLKRSQELDF